jgi:hypothetical protein
MRLLILVLATVLGMLSVPGLAAATKGTKPSKTHHPKGPTAKQIRAAVAGAERSPDLWATVNCCGVCPGSSGSDVVGIRGQMPSLGFATTLLMDISVDYWSTTDSKFESANASSTISLGKGTHGVHQGGVSFPFATPGAGASNLVRGTITFEWKLGTKVIGKVVRNTGHGYSNVGYSSPPGFTAGVCTLT